MLNSCILCTFDLFRQPDDSGRATRCTQPRSWPVFRGETGVTASISPQLIPTCLASEGLEPVGSYEWSETYRTRWGHFNFCRCRCVVVRALRKVFDKIL